MTVIEFLGEQLLMAQNWLHVRPEIFSQLVDAEVAEQYGFSIIAFWGEHKVVKNPNLTMGPR